MAVDRAATATGSVGTGAAALDALIAAELDALAADAQALQSQVAVGDVVQAQVLPPNGLTDLISILGNRVAAALPPSLTPGDVVSVQVTGFDGAQILMQIVANEPPNAAAGEPLANPAAGAPAAISPAPAPVAGAPVTSAAAAATAPRVAPPVAVFVAASVRPSPAETVAPAQPTRTGGPAGGTAANVPPAPDGTDADVAAIETRLAVARAGVSGKFAGSAPAARPATVAVPPAIPRAFGAPPPIVTPARFLPIAGGSPVDAAGAPAPPAAGVSSPPAAQPVAPSSFTDPTALVRALRLPATPTNLAAAQLALFAPQRLPAALATLERALPQLDDPRIQTLRTITAFLSKIEPSSPELAGQIAAYVDQVVVGGDAKLAQLLAAHNTVATAEAPVTVANAESPTTVASSESPSAGAPPASTAASAAGAAVTEPAVPVVALAQIVERVAAMATDLKTQLQQLLAAPPSAGASDDLVPAAATALAAVTGVQLAAAQNALASPQQINFALPLWLGNGYTQARVAIDRDAPDGRRAPLDGDNFHIAFVLDTKNLGTVNVDLVTVGRAFSLAVKTAEPASAKRFADALDRLTARLETLRYSVHSAEATVSRPGAPSDAVDVAGGDPAATVSLRV